MAKRSPSSATWYVVADGSDCEWRALMPARHLGAKVRRMSNKQSKLFMKPSKRLPFKWSETDDGAEYPDHEGVAVWTRPCMVRAMHAAAMSANGYPTVAEVDDNYLSPSNQNVFMRINGYNEEKRRSHMQAFATFDRIVTSTEWLANEYRKTMKQELRHVPEIVVARNHVDLDNWHEPAKDWDGLRVGIMGSQQHGIDWRLAAPALRLAHDMGCEIVFIGLDPATYDPKWKEFLPGYTHIPWVAPEEYHKKGLPLDIGLCPLVSNRHTFGKSDVKMLEYAMSGVATVAQNNVVYQTIRHGDTGLLAGSPDEMALMTLELIKNKSFRLAMVERAQQYVREERSIQNNLDEWKDAIGV